ncbi:MAG TPA: hypothetical protein ACFYD9_04365 [Candidatus Wunengus sp. YC64]
MKLSEEVGNGLMTKNNEKKKYCIGRMLEQVFKEALIHDFYPGKPVFEAVMIVVPGGISGLNQTLYVNGAGTHVRSTIEFLGHYYNN